ncbi:MAG: hypothetical protein VX354_02135 [Pseudomonadota bacterium]
MSQQVLLLSELLIKEVLVDSDNIVFVFDKAYIEKSMDNAVNKTLWMQAGCIKIENPSFDGDLPTTPFSIEHADILDNIYILKDMVPLPLDSQGEVAFEVQIAGLSKKNVFKGTRIVLILDDLPKYIKHIEE